MGLKQIANQASVGCGEREHEKDDQNRDEKKENRVYDALSFLLVGCDN